MTAGLGALTKTAGSPLDRARHGPRDLATTSANEVGEAKRLNTFEAPARRYARLVCRSTLHGATVNAPDGGGGTPL